jgi:hypothetical protein
MNEVGRDIIATFAMPELIMNHDTIGAFRPIRDMLTNIEAINLTVKELIEYDT